MTNPTPHGQVPEALIDLIDAYAETRHRCGIYNGKTEAARNAVIEALSGAQALSAAPAIGDELRDTLVAVSAAIAERDDRAAQKMICEILAASTTPPAEQQAQPGAVYAELHEPDATTVGLGAVWNRHSMRDFADRTHALRMQAAPKAAPGVGNSGFDHQTAADFLSGKTVSDEAVRKFVQASRWAHGEKAALSAMLLSVRGVLASREAEIALLKKALLEAEAAPQQEAQEPIGHLRMGPKEEFVATKRAEELDIDVWHPVFTAQPAPQQEAQEPHGWLYEWTHSSATGKPDSTYTAFTTDEAHARKHDNCRAIYTAPQQEAQEPVGVVEHAQAQTSYIHWTAAPPPNGAKLYTAPQPAPLSDDTERLEWLLWKLPGDALRYVVGELADTSSGSEFRAAIDAALAAQGGK